MFTLSSPPGNRCFSMVLSRRVLSSFLGVRYDMPDAEYQFIFNLLVEPITRRASGPGCPGTRYERVPGHQSARRFNCPITGIREPGDLRVPGAISLTIPPRNPRKYTRKACWSIGLLGGMAREPGTRESPGTRVHDNFWYPSSNNRK